MNWEHDSMCIRLEMTTLERKGGCHLIMNVGQTHCLCVCHERPQTTIRDTFIHNSKQKFGVASPRDTKVAELIID